MAVNPNAGGAGGFPGYAAQRLIGGVIRSWNQGPAFSDRELDILRSQGVTVRYMGRGVPQLTQVTATGPRNISVKDARRILRNLPNAQPPAVQAAVPTIPGLGAAAAAGRFVWQTARVGAIGVGGAAVIGAYYLGQDAINRLIYDATHPKRTKNKRRKKEKKLRQQLQQGMNESARHREQLRIERQKFAEGLELIDLNRIEMSRVPDPELAQVWHGVRIGSVSYGGVTGDPWRVKVTPPASATGTYRTGPMTVVLPKPATVPSATSSSSSSSSSARSKVWTSAKTIAKQPWFVPVVSAAGLAALSARPSSKRARADGPGPGVAGDTSGLTYLSTAGGYSPSFGSGDCVCPSGKTGKRRKKRCRNPRTSSRKYTRGGRRYQTITRRLDCPA